MVSEAAEEYLSRESLEEPCCLVLDVRLGGMNGFDLQNRLAERGATRQRRRARRRTTPL